MEVVAILIDDDDIRLQNMLQQGENIKTQQAILPSRASMPLDHLRNALSAMPRGCEWTMVAFGFLHSMHCISQ